MSLLPEASPTPERLFRTQIALLEAFQGNQQVLMDRVASMIDEFRTHASIEIETDRLRTTDLTARLSQLYDELTLMKQATDSFAVAMTNQIARDQEQMDLRDRAIIAIQHTLQQLSATAVVQQSNLGATQDQVNALEGRIDALTPDEAPA